MIAEMQGQHARADWWFARAERRRAPHIPFTDAMWGQALLERGQPDAAIEKFKLANQKGPHFADPLEGWGEALMAKNHSAPGAGEIRGSRQIRAQLGPAASEMGRGALYAGKKDEAKTQFARAAQLDLTPPEKSELSSMNRPAVTRS